MIANLCGSFWRQQLPTAKVTGLAHQLPANYSSDPCDRLIVATALAEGIALVTKDAKIRNCKPLSTIW